MNIIKNARSEYTDIEYLTLEEFKNRVKKTKFKDFWENEMKYREQHSFTLPVKFNTEGNLFIVQTPWILQKEIYTIINASETQKTILYKIKQKYDISILLQDLYDKKIVTDISYLLNRMNLGVGSFNIENLINKSYIPEDKHEEQALMYYHHMIRAKDEWIEPIELNKLFFNSEQRKENRNKYFAFNGKQLIDSYNETIIALKDKKINSYIVKASILYFNLKKNNYFASHNYRTTILSLYSFFNKIFIKDILNAISFFKLFKREENNLDIAFNNTLKYKGDLTYIYLIFLKIFQNINKLALKTIKDFMINDAQMNAIMPKNKKNISVYELCLKYPKLSYRAAKFYVSHNNNQENYTIKHFQDYLSCAYETARYSLESLVKLKLYRKKRLGKKFIYNPR